MEPEFEAKLEKMLVERANESNITVEELLSSGLVRRFSKSLTSRAAKLQIDPRDLLNEELCRMRKSEYPGPDCLAPSEIEAALSGNQLPPNRVGHLRTCESCASLLATANPSDAELAQICEEIRQLAPALALARPPQALAVTAVVDPNEESCCNGVAVHTT